MICYTGEKDKVIMRNVFASSLVELIEKDKNVMYLDADLMNSIGTLNLMSEYKDNVVNCGIQEANMVGVAAGLSAVGKIPYVHTFGPFASRRCFDQVFLSSAYAKNPVHVFGSDPGVTAAFNGGTHMPFEDVAMYRTIPEAVIFDVADTVSLHEAMLMVKDINAVTYVRFPRKDSVKVYSEGTKFEVGKAKVLREGKDLTVVASGIMIAEALGAAEKLAKEGIDVEVIDPVTVKPLDVKTIVESAKKTGAVLTAENANILGGMGGAVCEALAENYPVPAVRVGVEDKFGEVGPEGYLREKFELTQDKIILKAKEVLKRK